MSIRTNALMGLAVAALASVAGADICTWDFARGNNDPINDAGGRISAIAASFDTVTNAFSWQVDYSNQITDGFWLAVSPGENPKGHAGELALIYADFNRPTPVLTIYAYNGVNGDSSYRDGSPASGTQAPDRIASTLAGFTANMSKQNIGSGRRLSISFDASIVQNHVPAYDANRNEWTGLAFGTGSQGAELGLWMHSLDGTDGDYGNDGYLTDFDYDSQGWFDGAGYDVECVAIPAPGFAGLGLGGVLVMSRRRRA